MTDDREPDWSLIRHVRAQIAAGTYLNPARWAATVAIVSADLTGRSEDGSLRNERGGPMSDTEEWEQGDVVHDNGPGPEGRAYRDEPPKVVDRRSAAPEPAPASDGEATEFHRAVVQMALMQIKQTNGDRTRLAVLAKAQAVAAETMRRIVTQAELLNRSPLTFTPAEVLVIVLRENKLDEERGSG